jgi:hypothetical protein
MSFTNCEICGRVIPAAESSTGVFLKTYCGCDLNVNVAFDTNVLRQVNYDARFKGRKEELLREYEQSSARPQTDRTRSVQPESSASIWSDQ